MNFCYDLVSLSDTQLTVHYHCPICGENPSPNRVWNNAQVAVPQQQNVNVNAQVAVLMPAHNNPSTNLPCAGSGQQMNVYVAAYKTATIALKARISSLAIPANWWQAI